MCEDCDQAMEADRLNSLEDRGDRLTPSTAAAFANAQRVWLQAQVQREEENAVVDGPYESEQDYYNLGELLDPAERFSGIANGLYGSAFDVLMTKHRDYGPKNISDAPGGPLNGLRVRMHDKLARINNLIDSGAEPENESLRDSFLDLMNYSAIGMLVIDGNWPES